MACKARKRRAGSTVLFKHNELQSIGRLLILVPQKS